MAKRFTDTGKWDDPWFSALPNVYKLFWIHLLDKCDMAGGWKVHKPMVEFCLGGEVSLEKFLELAGDRIEVLRDGEIWFIKKFIRFQYGNLSSTNKIYNSINNALVLNGGSKGDLCPLDGAKDKDKDMDKDKRGGAGELSTGNIDSTNRKLYRPPPLHECKNCGRFFNEKLYESHLKICRKS